jgi:hypothetical protein
MANEIIVINYKEIVEEIEKEILQIRDGLLTNGDSNISDQIKFIKNIVVRDEQGFLKKKSAFEDLHTVYIVVKFSSGSINFGTSISPISLICVGTANKVKPIQILMSVFTSTFTTKKLGKGQNTIENFTVLNDYNIDNNH